MSGHVSEAMTTDVLLAPRRRRGLRTELVAVATNSLILWDVLSITSAGYLCAVLYGSFLARHHVADSFFGDTGGLSLLGGLLAAFVFSDQKPRRPGRRARNQSVIAVASGTFGRVVLLMSLLLAIMFLTRIGDRIPRLWMLMWAALILAATVISRLVLLQKLGRTNAVGTISERIAVCGSRSTAQLLISHLRREHGQSVELTGVFDDDGDVAGNYVGDHCSRIIELGKRHELDWVILALPAGAPEDISRMVHELKALDVQVAVCPQVDELILPNAEPCHFGNLPMMLLVNRPIGKSGLLIKELTDRLVSALAVVALAPLLLVISIAIRRDSPGPIIFRQRRHGRNNTEFEVLKFRTMHLADPGTSDGRFQTQRRDARVTRLGAFLRISSLDELPQLFNVLRGEMSLVGPRPHPCEMRTEDRLSADIIADYAHRHRVKPGITGWAQINGYRGATATADQMRQRVEHDLYYIDNWSFMFDLKILLLTPIKLIFDRENAF